MTESISNPVSIAAVISLVFLSMAALCAVIRLFLGPSLPDRIAALDLIGMVVIGIIGCYSVYTDESVCLDVAIALALVIFLGTVSFARYLEKGLQS